MESLAKRVKSETISPDAGSFRKIEPLQRKPDRFRSAGSAESIGHLSHRSESHPSFRRDFLALAGF